MSCKHAEDVCQHCLQKKVWEENEEQLQNELDELRGENIKLLKERTYPPSIKSVVLGSAVIGLTTLATFKMVSSVLNFNLEIAKAVLA